MFLLNDFRSAKPTAIASSPAGAIAQAVLPDTQWVAHFNGLNGDVHAVGWSHFHEVNAVFIRTCSHPASAQLTRDIRDTTAWINPAKGSDQQLAGRCSRELARHGLHKGP